MSGPARLVLVRHARPAEAGVLVFGSLDVELGATGLEQATGLVESLAGEPVAAVYSSPLRRAVDTARPLAARLGVEPVVVDALREMDFGELEGLGLAEIETRYPGLVRWTEAPAEAVFPGGERVDAVARRAVHAARAIAAAHAGETAVVVAHGVTIRTILADALDLPLASLFRLHLSHCGLSVVEWYGGQPLVRAVNAARI